MAPPLRYVFQSDTGNARDGVKILPALRYYNFFLWSSLKEKKEEEKATPLSAGAIPARQLFLRPSCFHCFVKGDVTRKEGERERTTQRGRGRCVQCERVGE